jgi:hypothetical protein
LQKPFTSGVARIGVFIVQSDSLKLKIKEEFRLELWEEGMADFLALGKPTLPIVLEEGF